MTDFTSNSSAYGLKLAEFSDLPQQTRRKITRMMARVMERAYRRGAQHGVAANHDEHWFADWRLNGDIDKSIGIDGYNSTSTHRLEMEEPIQAVGLGMD